jgi:alanine dehydrogenase
VRIGIPRETKPGEFRVALVPEHAAILALDGHEVRVASGSGGGAGQVDTSWLDAGASIVAPDDAWDAELIVKVKEVQEADYPHLRAGQTLFCFHHLPGEPDRTRAVAASGITAIAFEMVRDADGGYPLLAPMSEIAGRMVIDVAARHLGRAPRNVLVLGAGHAGRAAERAAIQQGASVTLLRRATATPEAVARAALEADLVVGAVFVPGAPTPKLLPRALVARMKRGAVIVDISIDAGGVAETSRPTTHARPTFVEEGVIHYCVPNMPAAEPALAAVAISTAALPFARELAAKGVARAVRENAALRSGVLVWKGRVNHEGIAKESGLAYTPLSDRDLED